MPGKGKQTRGRGRGGHRGRSRGRGSSGRGGFGGGGGRGRNRDLIATSLGYVYRLESNVDEYNDDFRVYGQFSSDEEDSEVEMIRANLKKKGKKGNFALKKQSRSPLESSYVENVRANSPNGSAATRQSTSQQFAKGKSKYLKTVLFTKSSSVLNSADENSADENQDKDGDKLAAPLAEMSLNESTSSKSTGETLWTTKKRNIVTTTETVDFADFESNQYARTSVKLPADSNTSEETQDADETVVSNELLNTGDTDDFGHDVEPEQHSSEDDSDDFGLDDDDLLDEERYMEDYIDKAFIELLTESNDDGEDLYDYAALDQDEDDGDNLSDEEAAVISSYKKFHHINEDVRKKKSHRTRDDYATVDPEIFGQSLHAALADIPKPGSRKWDEKQQRRENRKKKKEDAKLFRKEKKKKNKGKPGTREDNSYPQQLLKIDERIRDFIMDDSINSFQFAPMGAHLRRQIHIMAAFYNLKSKSGGTGEFRCTMISKTNETYIPSDRRNIERFLSDSQVNVDEQTRIIEKNRKKFASTSKKSSGSSTPKTKPKVYTSKSIPTVGSIVAFDAPPINEDNVGHRMLAAMGWKQGDALGSTNNGITAPIEAVIRKKNQGLGS